MTIATITALLIAAMPAQAETPTPLIPAGKWQVSYEESLCVLSRDYAVGDKRITFGIRPWPMAEWMEIVLLQPGHGAGSQSGKATVTLEPGGNAISGQYTQYFLAKDQGRLATIKIPTTALGALADATSISIAVGAQKPVVLGLVKMQSALHALSTCSDDLLRSWHIDPDERSRVATPPQGLPSAGDWISFSDYPPDALAGRRQGTVVIVWTIGTDGRVADCRVVQSSGDTSLDAGACPPLIKRARYKPALDKDGNPIAVHSTRRVVWRLPE